MLTKHVEKAILDKAMKFIGLRKAQGRPKLAPITEGLGVQP